MGRKSSLKNSMRAADAAGAPPPEPPARGRSPLLIVAVLAVVAVVGLLAYASRSDRPADTAEAVAQTQPPQPPPADNVPEAAKHGPHPQKDLPPLPLNASMPARPAEVVRASYQFAAEHPEVLSYVPCYCGCEHSGHRGNEDCFVTARNDKGDVTEWEPHGMT